MKLEVKQGDWEGLTEAARTLLKAAGNRNVWLLRGEMGSGKTTLVTALCKELGVLDHPTSPTFSLANQYQLPNGSLIHHLDLYRLETPEAFWDAGLEECLISGDYCWIEWPDLAMSFLSDPPFELHLERTETSHVITFN